MILLLILATFTMASNVLTQTRRSSLFEDDLNNIFFRLYTSDSMNQFIDSPLLEVRNLVVQMNLEKPIVFYLHGYTGSTNSRDVIAVVTAYLKRGDHNTISIDWSKIAGKNYPSVVSSAKAVGNAIAGAIDEMVDQGVPQKNIHVVGHSMGAQVAGYIGRQASFQLTRITGLDPAGPFFNLLEAHLTAKDAKFVDTIHTDAGFYGINRASGIVSFYPNGGRRVQPGCPISFELSSPEEYCSHHRSWIFYAESLINEHSFIGVNCNSHRKFFNGNCNENVKIPMGYATPSDAKGIFYLTTKSTAPFGMQIEGAISKFPERDTNIIIYD